MSKNDKLNKKGGITMDDLRRMKKDNILVFLIILFSSFSSFFYFIRTDNDLGLFIASIIILLLVLLASILRFKILIGYSDYSIVNALISNLVMLLCNALCFLFSLFLSKGSYPKYIYIIAIAIALVLSFIYLLIDDSKLRKRYLKLRMEAYKY